MTWVFSTIHEGVSWAAGTSMAVPAAAAIAALIIEEAGGNLTTAQVKATMAKRTIHPIGNVGRDEPYGHGHVPF